MSRFMRLRSLACVVCCVILQLSDPLAAEDRIVFLSLTDPPDLGARTGLQTWAQRFGLGLEGLIAEVEFKEKAGQTKITIRRHDVPNPIPRKELEDWWLSARTLHAVRAVAAQQDKITIIDSDIYLGDLKGTLSTPYVQITQFVEPGSYKVARDALSIVTLYAVAMDIAKHLPPGASQSRVCQPLQKANLYRQDFNDKVRKELEDLFKAVQDNLESRGCRGAS